MQDIAANFTCQEFDAYTNLIGMNSICKTRWTGQWQGAGPGQQSQLTLSDSPPQSSSPIDDQQRQQQQQTAGNLMTIDQVQQPMSVEQILSQLVSQSTSFTETFIIYLVIFYQNQQSIIPQAIEHLTLTSPLPPLSLQCHSTAMVNCADGGQQAQLQTLGDAQQQAKLVFNVETDKSSPPLQLLFQLPPVQGGQTTTGGQVQQAGGQQQSTIITSQSQQLQISSTPPSLTMGQQQQQHPKMMHLPQNLINQANLQQHQQHILNQPHLQHCNVHSQVRKYFNYLFYKASIDTFCFYFLINPAGTSSHTNSTINHC